MSTLTVTNISPTSLWLRDLYVELSPGEEATITRTPAEMGSMIGLQEFISEGKIEVNITLDAHEAPSELVAVWPLGLNWRPTVASSASLPTTKNRLGDVRLAIASLTLHVWDGTAWQGLGGGGGGGVSSVTASAPLASSGGATPNITFTNWPANASGALTNNGSGALAWSAMPTGTIAGTISPNEVAFGTDVDVIGGSSDLTWNPGTGLFTIGGAGLYSSMSTLDDGGGNPILRVDAVQVQALGANGFAALDGAGHQAEFKPTSISLGDYTGSPSPCVLTGFPSLDLQLANELLINSDAGTSGYVFTTRGPGQPPVWANPLSANFVLGTGAIQDLVADTDAITPVAPLHRVTASLGNRSLTATPTINFPGAVLGQTIIIQNVDPANHVILNQGAATKLALSNSTSKLDPGGTVFLVFDGTNWVEVAHVTATST